MKKEIEDRFPLLGGIRPREPLSDDELRSVEENLGVALPKDYRDFIATYGAALFGELVEFPLPQGRPMYIPPGGRAHKIEGGPFSNFYGSKSGKQSLAREIKMYTGRMPETMIPIGDDGAGNQICLGIKGKDQGKVYYWIHDNEWDEEDYLEENGKPMPPEVKYQNVYLIADSFEDFIHRLAVHKSL